MQPLLPITNGFLNVRWQFKFKTDGTELPASDISSRSLCCRARYKSDSTRAETRFGLSEKWTSLFKSAAQSVQATAGSRGVRISGQTMHRPCSEAQCKSSGYPLQSPISPSLPLPRVTVCHHISNGFYYRWCAHLGWTDDPANLNGLVRFAERRYLVSARVPSHFKWSVLQMT